MAASTEIGPAGNESHVFKTQSFLIELAVHQHNCTKGAGVNNKVQDFA